MKKIHPFLLVGISLLALFGLAAAFDPRVSQFNAISLNQQPNILSMSNNFLTLDGIPIRAGLSEWTNNTSRIYPIDLTKAVAVGTASPVTLGGVIIDGSTNNPIISMTARTGATHFQAQWQAYYDGSGNEIQVFGRSSTFDLDPGGNDGLGVRYLFNWVGSDFGNASDLHTYWQYKGTNILTLGRSGQLAFGSITKAQKTALTPTNGMLVYQSDNTPGFRVYVGGAWLILNTSADP